MKRIFGAIVLGAALCLSIAAAPANSNRIERTGCVDAPELVLQAEVDGSFIGRYDAELTGAISNSSASRDYEDISIMVDYFDEEGRMIGDELVEIDKDFNAGESEEISVDLDAPSDAVSANYTIVCAEYDRTFRERLRFWNNW